MSIVENILDNIEHNFGSSKKCILIDDKEFILIVDFKGQSYIVNDLYEDGTYELKINDKENITVYFTGSDGFKVSNISNIVFVPIDGKDGLLGYGISYCDCVIFDNQDFCFVEFKLNATSLTEGAIRKNRNKAVDQLGSTIQLFDQKFSNNYHGLKLEAYVCTPETYPREEAGWENYRVSFLEEHGIELFERGYKVCK